MTDNESLLIVVICGHEPSGLDAYVYEANSEEEAEQFCKLWDRQEQRDGSPGRAFVIEYVDSVWGRVPASHFIQEELKEQSSA